MLLIFDCDGVLVDSEPIARRVLAELLAEIGFPVPNAASAENHTGVSLPAVMAMIEKTAGRALPPDFAACLRLRSQRAFDNDLQAMPAVAEALACLTVPKCVASSGSPQKIRRNLALTGLLAYFEPYLFSAEMVACGKPAPDLFLYAAQRMGESPADCIVIEDSVAGVQAGVAAGMRVIGFVGGGHCRPVSGARLLAAGAASVCERMTDLAAGVGWLTSSRGR